MEIALILILGLLPPTASLVAMRRLQRLTQQRLRRASQTERYYRPAWTWDDLIDDPLEYQLPAFCDRDYLEHRDQLIGDPSCRFNARSPLLRCAVNPQGPCHTCPSYESLEYLSQSQSSANER